MRTVGLLTALIAMVAFGAMMLGQSTTPAVAGGLKPDVSLNADCGGSTVDKCTMNVTDTTDVDLKVAGAASPYGNWTMRVNTSNSSVAALQNASIPTAACLGQNSKANTSGAPEKVFACTDADGTSIVTTFGSLTVKCVGTGNATISVKNITINGDSGNAANSLNIHCGESADMSLTFKPDPGDVLVNDKITVTVNLSDLKTVDDTGYNGWTTRVNFSSGLTLAAPTVKLPVGGQSLVNQGATSVLVGSTVGVGNPPETAPGNLVNLNFTCNTAGVHAIDLKSADSNLLTAKGGTATLTHGANLTVDCRSAAMSLSLKSGFKAGTTNRVPKGDEFVVNINVDDIEKFTYDTLLARTEYQTSGQGVVTFVSANYISLPCVTGAALLEADDGNRVRTNCKTVDSISNSTFEAGKAIELTLKCLDPGLGAGQTDTVSIFLVNAGSDTGLENKASAIEKPHLGAALTVECVGSATNADGDGCTVAQETALATASGVSMDPNRFDLADAVGSDSKVLTADVLSYVQAFGEARTGPGNVDTTVPGDVEDADTIIDDGDINRAVDQFGYTDCV